MTLDQAEKEYKFCFGNEGYYMWHEIGEKAYREYCDLYIPRETKAKWDTEMNEKDLDALYESPSGASSWFDRIIDALARGYMDVNKYADKLKFCALNTSKARRVAIAQKVLGLPVMAIYKDGAKVEELVKDDATEENIAKMVEKYVALV